MTNKNTRKNKRGKLVGGKVVASGGYGCIFKPAIKCKDKNKQKNRITKLMTRKHAKVEYNDIVRYKPILETIPNYSDYFLINHVELCYPDTLTRSDIKGYNDKCRALKKDKITSKNINKSLHKLSALNMPNGGIDIGDYVDKENFMNNFAKLNTSLIDLLLHGIIPMNKKNIYHCDVKESNILVDENQDTMYTRLIDWGLSTKYMNSVNIPKPLYRRPFQYNVPFSNILFNHTFSSMYANFLADYPNPTHYQLRPFVLDYIFIWMDERGPGHIKIINSIMRTLFKHDINMNKEALNEIIEFEFTYYYIVEYIIAILIKFSKNGKFEGHAYFTEVFMNNIDVWGFVMSYSPIIEMLSDNYDKLTKKELMLFDQIKQIFITCLFETPTEVIDVDKLVGLLRKLY